MKLVIFDIDGTLTNTSAVDAVCFAQALQEIHDLQASEAEWQACPHVSDTGITEHLFQMRFSRAPHVHEEATLRDHFVNLMAAQHAQDAAQFAEITGAVAMLEQLAEKRDWAIAVATGCWQASAQFKLRAAQISLHQNPAGFAEDGPARETIVRAAIARASQHYNRTSFDKIVSVGDGLWDVRTAANLGLAFVGIASEPRAETLRRNGARHVVPDFENPPRFFDYLEQAETPIPSLAATR
jgi:phosphoglycolate phosphatase-like HAD superfamily hydrolase